MLLRACMISSFRVLFLHWRTAVALAVVCLTTPKISRTGFVMREIYQNCTTMSGPADGSPIEIKYFKRTHTFQGCHERSTRYAIKKPPHGRTFRKALPKFHSRVASCVSVYIFRACACCIEAKGTAGASKRHT